MAPLPQNNTSRLFFDYIARTGGPEHAVAVRLPTGATPADGMLAFYNFLTAVGDARFLNGWRVSGARFQPASVDFSLPVALSPAVSGFVGVGGIGSTWGDAQEFLFVGRSSSSGRRCRLPLYGLAGIAGDTNYRINVGEGGYDWLETAIIALNAEAYAFVAIDGTKPQWYQYLNWQFNSYWEDAIRRSG